MLKKHYELTPEQRLIKGAKRRSKKGNLEYNLTTADITIPKYCPILGLELGFNTGGPGKNSPALDRIDNTRGYTKDNVAVISHRANQLKSDLTIEQVKKLLEYMQKENK